MIHIGIDGNLLVGKKTGMGVVTYSVLKNWIADSSLKVTVFIPSELDEESEKILISNGIEVIMLKSKNYIVWEQIVIPIAVKKYNIDVLWCPYNTAPFFIRCKTVLTVHDLIFMKSKLRNTPSVYKKLGLIYRKLTVPRAIKKADKIITISEYTKKEILDYYPNEKDKINVIYNGIDKKNSEMSKKEFKEFLLENKILKKYILGFGSLEPRKNTMRLIKAYQMLSENIKKEYQLVLFGFRGYKRSEEYKYITSCNLETEIVVLEYISDKQKNSLYKNSELFVFPSLSEGFGIPILEAYVNQSAIITSNTTAMPEIAGDGALYIDPFKSNNIKDGIEKLITNPELKENLKKNGEKQLTLFNWKKTTIDTMNVLKGSIKNE